MCNSAQGKPAGEARCRRAVSVYLSHRATLSLVVFTTPDLHPAVFEYIDVPEEVAAAILADVSNLALFMSSHLSFSNDVRDARRAGMHD